MDKEGKRPNHGDEDDIFVGFTHQEGGGQEENDGCKGQEHPQGRPFLQKTLDFVFCFLVHRINPENSNQSSVMSFQL